MNISYRREPAKIGMLATDGTPATAETAATT